MHDTSSVPVRRVDDARIEAVRQPKSTDQIPGSAAFPSIKAADPRKLVRPRLPEGLVSKHFPNHLADILSLSHDKKPKADNNHSEAFYLQKQINGQTRMVFVLEDGEQIEGHIEWYDRNTIKVKNGALRTLLYKASIKYLYKAGDTAAR